MKPVKKEDTKDVKSSRNSRDNPLTVDAKEMILMPTRSAPRPVKRYPSAGQAHCCFNGFKKVNLEWIAPCA